MARAFPESAIGAFGDLGGEVITIEWVPDPHVVEQSILRVAGYLEQIDKPLLAARAIAREDMRMRFQKEVDPDGNAWVELDPDYLTRKQAEGSNTGILKRWGDLEDAATSGSAFIVAGDSLFFSMESLPFYAGIHQEGSGTHNVGTARDWRERTAAATAAGVPSGGAHESLGIGTGKATPARPFIGISGEAEEQIFEVFDLWFAEGVSIGISSSGTVQERISGRFGKKLYPDLGSLA